MRGGECDRFTPRKYNRSLVHDLDILGQIDDLGDLYHLAHVIAWEPFMCNLRTANRPHGFASVLRTYKHPVRTLTLLNILDRDVADVWKVGARFT